MSDLSSPKGPSGLNFGQFYFGDDIVFEDDWNQYTVLNRQQLSIQTHDEILTKESQSSKRLDETQIFPIMSLQYEILSWINALIMNIKTNTKEQRPSKTC